MAIEIVDFPIENGGSFHSYVSLPEGTLKSMVLFSTPWTSFADHEASGQAEHQFFMVDVPAMLSYQRHPEAKNGSNWANYAM